MVAPSDAENTSAAPLSLPSPILPLSALSYVSPSLFFRSSSSSSSSSSSWSSWLSIFGLEKDHFHEPTSATVRCFRPDVMIGVTRVLIVSGASSKGRSHCHREHYTNVNNMMMMMMMVRRVMMWLVLVAVAAEVVFASTTVPITTTSCSPNSTTQIRKHGDRPQEKSEQQLYAEFHNSSGSGSGSGSQLSAGADTWLIGVGLSLFGSIVDNLGITLQKYAHLHNTRGAAYWKLPHWLAGFGLFLIGNIANTAGLGWAPQSLFAALGCVSVVANIVNSRLFLSERVTVMMVFGVVLIVGGSTMALLFGSHETQAIDIHDLADDLTVLFACFGGVLVLLIFGLLISIIVTERRRFVVTDPTETTPFATAAPIPSSTSTANAAAVVVGSSSLSPSSVAGVVTPVAGASSTPVSPASAAAAALLASGRGTEIGLSFGADVGTVPMLLHRRTSDVERGIEQEYHRRFLMFAYPAFAGLVGSVTVLFAKSSAELLKTTFYGDDQLIYFETWILFGITLGSAVVQIHWMNVGLSLFCQMAIVPTFFCCYTTFSILGGFFFFDEWKNFSTIDWFLFPLACIITFTGVYYVARDTPSDAPTVIHAPPRRTPSSSHAGGFDRVDDFEGGDGSVPTAPGARAGRTIGDDGTSSLIVDATSPSSLLAPSIDASDHFLSPSLLVSSIDSKLASMPLPKPILPPLTVARRTDGQQQNSSSRILTDDEHTSFRVNAVAAKQPPHSQQSTCGASSDGALHQRTYMPPIVPSTSSTVTTSDPAPSWMSSLTSSAAIPFASSGVDAAYLAVNISAQSPSSMSSPSHRLSPPPAGNVSPSHLHVNERTHLLLDPPHPDSSLS